MSAMDEDNNLLHPIQKWPERSPLDLIARISSYVKDKTVCDMGAGCGDLLYEIRRLGLSDDIIGIEKDAWFHNQIRKLEVSDREYMVHDNFESMEIPKADVYLLWMCMDQYGIINNLPKSIIIDLIGEPTENHLSRMTNKLNVVEKIEYDYDEEKYFTKGVYKDNPLMEKLLQLEMASWSMKGKRKLIVYEKND